MNFALSAISVLVLLAGCVFFPIISISETTPTDFNFYASNGTITITNHIGSAAVVNIPDSINGLLVTRIAPFAFFNNCDSILVISIPRTIIKLGNDSVIPFFCRNLTTIIIDPNNKYYSSMNGLLFNKDKTTLIQCPMGKSGLVMIPDSVLNIRQDSFMGCSRMTNVTIPNSVTNIGYGAFAGCDSLTNVAVPDSVISMSGNLFGKCTKLVYITVGRNVKDIGWLEFSYCDNLKGIYFRGDAPKISPDLFDRNSKAMIYYKIGTRGWGKEFGGRPTAVWKEPGDSK